MKFLIFISLFYFIHSGYSIEASSIYEIKDSLILRKATDKYINVFEVAFYPSIMKGELVRTEIKHEKNLWDEAMLADKQIVLTEEKRKKKDSEKDVKSDLTTEYDEKKSEALYKALKKSGYVDTINRIFGDRINTVYLKGVITNIHYYTISEKNSWGSFKPTYHIDKLFIKWYIKNSYRENLDSINTEGLTDDYALWENIFTDADQEKYRKKFLKVKETAVISAYLQLHKNPKFIGYIQQEKNLKITDAELLIKKPTGIIADKEEVITASVIVKTDNGHGSGFLISNDGYIITNYHVVSEKNNKKVTSVKIIKSDGTELTGSVIRINKYRDLALIKVDGTFEKAFFCSDVKSYKKFMNVYTVGAPKSIELGQSISAGMISNERSTSNNPLLQLSISVNKGNSGGPLYDATGVLHGVIVSKLFGENTEGVGFAVPSYLIQEYLNIKFN